MEVPVLAPDVLGKYDLGLEKIDDNCYKSDKGFLFLKNGSFSHFAVYLPVQEKLINEVPKVFNLAKKLGAKVDEVIISDYTTYLDMSQTFVIKATRNRFNYARTSFPNWSRDYIEQLLPNFKLDLDHIKTITKTIDPLPSNIQLTFKVDEATDLEYLLNKSQLGNDDFRRAYKVIRYPVRYGERKLLEDFTNEEVIKQIKDTLRIILNSDSLSSEGFAFTGNGGTMFLCPPSIDSFHKSPPISYQLSKEDYKFRIIHPWQLCYENDIGLGVRIDSIHVEVYNKPILIFEDTKSIEYYSKHVNMIKKKMLAPQAN